MTQLVVSWDVPLPTGAIHSGTYNHNSHGMPNDWAIYPDSIHIETPNADYLRSIIPYQNQPYMYIFEPFDQNLQSPINRLITKLHKITTLYPVLGETQFVLLCDRQFSDTVYNHQEETLTKILSGQLDQDKFGGSLLYAKLR